MDARQGWRALEWPVRQDGYVKDDDSALSNTIPYTRTRLARTTKQLPHQYRPGSAYVQGVDASGHRDDDARIAGGD